MRSVFCFIILSFWGTVCFGQRFTYNAGGATSKNYYEEIPYQYVNGKIFITVEIAGKKRKFLFDTGAPVQIMPALFKELNAPVIQRGLIGDATGRKDSLYTVTAPEIKIGNTSFTGIPAMVAGSDIYTCWQIEGVIGSNLIRNSIVRIEPEKQLLIITNDDSKLNLNKKYAATLVTDASQSYPFVVMWLPNKKTFLAGFDSGDAGFLQPCEADMLKISKYKAYEKGEAGYGAGTRSLFGLGNNDSTYRLKFPSLRIGTTTFTNAIAETNKTDMSRIGTKLLDNGTVTLDFIHHRFYYEPKGASDTISMAEKQWPLQPMIADGNKLIVGVVWQSLKGQALPGEQIVAIDDTPCETMDLCEHVNAKNGMLDGRETTTLTIKNSKGELRKLVINKE